MRKLRAKTGLGIVAFLVCSSVFNTASADSPMMATVDMELDQQLVSVFPFNHSVTDYEFNIASLGLTGVCHTNVIGSWQCTTTGSAPYRLTLQVKAAAHANQKVYALTMWLADEQYKVAKVADASAYVLSFPGTPKLDGACVLEHKRVFQCKNAQAMPYRVSLPAEEEANGEAARWGNEYAERQRREEKIRTIVESNPQWIDLKKAVRVKAAQIFEYEARKHQAHAVLRQHKGAICQADSRSVFDRAVTDGLIVGIVSPGPSRYVTMPLAFLGSMVTNAAGDTQNFFSTLWKVRRIESAEKAYNAAELAYIQALAEHELARAALDEKAAELRAGAVAMMAETGTDDGLEEAQGMAS